VRDAARARLALELRVERRRDALSPGRARDRDLVDVQERGAARREPGVLVADRREPGGEGEQVAADAVRRLGDTEERRAREARVDLFGRQRVHAGLALAVYPRDRVPVAGSRGAEGDFHARVSSAR